MKRASPTAIVITGASSGLGAMLAQSYARPGVRLGLTGRSTERLEAVAKLCRAAGSDVTLGQIDVSDAPAMTQWLLAFDAAGPVELLIANAGISGGPAPGQVGEGVTLATRQVTANLLGCINTVEPLLPLMAKRGRGQIAVIASVAGLRGLPYSAAYSASKAGVRAYGEGLRSLLRPTGLDVTVVCPGFFESPMTDRFQGDHPFLVTTKRAAAIVKNGLNARRSRISFHGLLALGLTLTNIMPARLGDAILRGVHFHIDPPA